MEMWLKGEKTDSVIFENILKSNTTDTNFINYSNTVFSQGNEKTIKSGGLKNLTQDCDPEKTGFLSQGVQLVQTTMEFAKGGGMWRCPGPQGRTWTIRIWMAVHPSVPSSLAIQGYCI